MTSPGRMSVVTQPQLTPGWYPDTSAPLTLRYWNGQNWTVQTRPIGGSFEGRPLYDTPGFSPALGYAVQVLLGLAAAISLFGAATEVWGFGVLSAQARSGVADVDGAQLYDQLNAVSSIAGLTVAAFAAVTWAIWQYRLAVRVPRQALRRSPGWHIASWFIPVVALWFPLQNVADLRGAVAGAQAPSGVRGPYLAWWLTWTSSWAISWVALRLSRGETSEFALANTTAALAVSDLLDVTAAVLAIWIVGDITRRAVAAFAPAQPPATEVAGWQG